MASQSKKKSKIPGLIVRSRNWVRGDSLYAASLKNIVLALSIAAFIWAFVGFSMIGNWTWGIRSGETTRADAVRIVLTMVAGVGGIIALTIAYRKQQGAEAGRFMVSLENAARQLGAMEPTVQFAGIYALAALADASGYARKQKCVDVLCAYLRLPYKGTVEASLVREIVERRTWFDTLGEVEETRTHQIRPADKEVRLTIIREIAHRLLPETHNSWSSLNMDFTGAVFDGGNFNSARFTGGYKTFREAKFNGGSVKFMMADFDGGKVDFAKAEFNSGDVLFAMANFNNGTVSFREAKFNGANVNFTGAAFNSIEVDFIDAEFNSGNVDFSHPSSWKAPPSVPWCDGTTPRGVLPSTWPPNPHEGTSN